MRRITRYADRRRYPTETRSLMHFIGDLSLCFLFLFFFFFSFVLRRRGRIAATMKLWPAREDRVRQKLTGPCLICSCLLPVELVPPLFQYRFDRAGRMFRAEFIRELIDRHRFLVGFVIFSFFLFNKKQLVFPPLVQQTAWNISRMLPRMFGVTRNKNNF